jgi:MFS family permease
LKGINRALALFVLILSGEVIFFLPFVIPRVFRPTFLSVFGIDNFELGTFYSVYGTIAIGAYLLGGPLADRFPAHKLMSLAMVLTGLGGLYLATIPDMTGMFWVYGFWGLTTILLFWASLMRTTRLLGGPKRQGIAFGMLDGGRGLVAAIVGTMAVALLSFYLPEDVGSASPEVREAAFQKVILFFCGFVFVTAILVRFVLKSVESSSEGLSERISWSRVLGVIKLPAVWLQAIIILCAYSGYRVADDFSLMAQDVLGYDEVESAGVGTLTLWMRPIAAISAGLLADRITSSRMTMFCFTLLCFGGLLMGFGPVETQAGTVVMITVVSTGLGVFALRGLYFAIMEEGNIPLAVTGTAVGLASIVGYLPDIYMAPIMGILIDNNPGVLGHQYVFMLLAGFAFVGFFAAYRFSRLNKVEILS